MRTAQVATLTTPVRQPIGVRLPLADLGNDYDRTHVELSAEVRLVEYVGCVGVPKEPVSVGAVSEIVDEG